MRKPERSGSISVQQKCGRPALAGPPANQSVGAACRLTYVRGGSSLLDERNERSRWCLQASESLLRRRTLRWRRYA